LASPRENPFDMNLVLILVSSVASAQLLDGPGSGVSKTTYSANDPLTALAFNLKYFPVTDAEDSCTNDVCTCTISGETYYAQQGRSQLKTESSAAALRAPQPGEGFGLHLVNCSMNPQPGGMSTAAIEAEFTSKLGDMSSYDAFMDYNVALYTSDLDSYIAAFDNDGVDYLATTWTDQGTAYYGVIVRSPGTQMLIELMAKNSTARASRRQASSRSSRSRARRRT